MILDLFIYIIQFYINQNTFLPGFIIRKEFDLWTDGYDKTVGISDEKNTYPFAGYKKVLGFIFQTIMKTENAIFWILGSGQVH